MSTDAGSSRLMRRERTDHPLSPTAVVHETVIRLLGEAIFQKAADRRFLVAAAARAMREVLMGRRTCTAATRDERTCTSARASAKFGERR